MGKRAILIQIFIIISLAAFSQNYSIWGLEYGEGSRDCLTYVREETGLTGIYSEKDATITYSDCDFYGVKVQEVVLYFVKNEFTRAEVIILPKSEFVAAIYEDMRSQLVTKHGNPTEDNFPNLEIDKLSTLWYIGNGKNIQTVQLVVEPITSKDRNINIYYLAGKVDKKVFEIAKQPYESIYAPAPTYMSPTTFIPQLTILWGLECGSRIEDVYNQIANTKNLYPDSSNGEKKLTYRYCIFAGEKVDEVTLSFSQKRLSGGCVRWPEQDRPTVLDTYKRLRSKLIAKYGKPHSSRIYYIGKQPYPEEEGYGIPEIEKKKQEKQEPDLTDAQWLVGENDEIEIDLKIEFAILGERHVSLTYRMK